MFAIRILGFLALCFSAFAFYRDGITSVGQVSGLLMIGGAGFFAIVASFKNFSEVEEHEADNAARRQAVAKQRGLQRYRAINKVGEFAVFPTPNVDGDKKVVCPACGGIHYVKGVGQYFCPNDPRGRYFEATRSADGSDFLTGFVIASMLSKGSTVAGLVGGSIGGVSGGIIGGSLFHSDQKRDDSQDFGALSFSASDDSPSSSRSDSFSDNSSSCFASDYSSSSDSSSSYDSGSSGSSSDSGSSSSFD